MSPLKKQSGFVLPIAILIAVVLIIAGGAGYYFYKTSQEQKEVEVAKPEQVIDETANWKIYKNEEYGFKVKYPANCSIEEITGESAFCPGDTKGIERLKYFEIKDCNTFVDIYNNPNNLGFGDWDDIYHTLTCTGSGFFSERISFSLNGVLAIRGLFGCCAQGQKAVAISKDKKVYIIYSRDSLDLADDSPDKKEREDWLKNDITKGTDIFSQILSTFKFIEIDETADWKTYRSEEYGYEIKYPQDWKTKERSLMSNLGHRDFVWIQSNGDEFSVDIWDFSFYSYDQLTELPPGGIDPDTIEKKEIIIDSQTATEFSYVAVGDGSSGARRVREVFIQKNQLLYKIRSIDSKKDDQVLSTFKFIK